MESTVGTEPVRRARIVMLVDNGVHGDSRVQKTARSAADAGWDVTLIGRSPSGAPQTWMMGEAKVQLVRMPRPLKQRRHEFRRHWITGPLAYPPTGIAAQREQSVKAWAADLAVRRALRSRGSGLGNTLAKQGLRAQTAAMKATRKWVGFRYWSLNKSQSYRSNLRSPWDRAYTWFWTTVSDERSWRRLEPELWDYELAYAPVVDALKPDIIYANDFRMLGVGARAKVRAAAKKRDIKLIWDVHEYLPGVKPRVDNGRWMVANHAHEREYAKHADAVITVSEKLAEMLQADHKLREMPTVVLNTPGAADMRAAKVPGAADIRTACGVGPGTPIVVYSGAAAVHRGMNVMVNAMPILPDVHVAMVVGDLNSAYMKSLVARAKELGTSDRLHLLPYVPHDQVVGFLSTATAGVIPIHHWLNHEIQLITKFFEYSHARLPIISSDCETMAATVRANGQGEVFRVEDVEDYARAVKAIVADPESYRAAYDKIDLDVWTWEAQAAHQDKLYRRLAPTGK